MTALIWVIALIVLAAVAVVVGFVSALRLLLRRRSGARVSRGLVVAMFVGFGVGLLASVSATGIAVTNFLITLSAP